ncbi:MAG TPA: hypothetical protein V6D11_14980 [Waterburya sp.]
MPLINVPGTQDDLTLTLTGLKPETIGAISQAEKGKPKGVASLGDDGVVPTYQLPDFHSPNLSELGGEPAGAETRAKAYTDEKIAQIPPVPPPPTLTQLGGEPVGAETRAKTYTDQKISQLPAPSTLVQLGGEPVGAETRAKTYTDQQISQLPKITRSTTVPSNPQEGDVWEQLDTNTSWKTPPILHVWRYSSGNWISRELQFQTHLFFKGDNSSENWEVRIWPNTPINPAKIVLAYIQVWARNYTVNADANNYWRFNIFGSNQSAENYYNQVAFKSGQAGQILQALLPFNSVLSLGTELIRLRIQADAVGNAGVFLADFSVSYFYQLNAVSVSSAAISNKVSIAIDGGASSASISAQTGLTVTISGLTGVDSVTRKWYQNGTLAGTSSTWNLSGGAFTRTLTANQLLNYGPTNPSSGVGSWYLEVSDGTNTYRSNSIQVVA